MRVTGPGRVSTTQKSKGTKSASKAGAKFSIPDQTPEVATPTNVASASPIASVDAMPLDMLADPDDPRDLYGMLMRAET